MAAIAWTDEAQRWLEDIFEYIATNNPQAAARTVQEIYEKAQVLARFPEIGHRTLPPPETSESCFTGITESLTS